MKHTLYAIYSDTEENGTQLDIVTTLADVATQCRRTLDDDAKRKFDAHLAASGPDAALDWFIDADKDEIYENHLDTFRWEEITLDLPIPGRIATACIRHVKGRCFAEEARRDDRGPYLQAWAVPPDQVGRLAEHDEVIIHVLNEADQFCHILHH